MAFRGKMSVLSRSRKVSFLALVSVACINVIADASREATPPSPAAQAAQTVTVRKGGDAVLGCRVPEFGHNGRLPPHLIQWLHGARHVLVKVGRHDPHISRDFKDRITIVDETSSRSLKIADVTLADAGWYRCRVHYLQGAIEELASGTWVKLEVTDPPSFVDAPPSLKIALEGDSLLLKCRATGRPEPVTTWRKDGLLVEDGQDGILLSSGDLAVSFLTIAHRGKYTCLAQSVEGQIRATTEVKVQAPPELVKKPWDLTTQEGRDAMFDCSATGYPSNIEYRWTYNGDPVDTSRHLRGRFRVLSDGSLIVYNIKTSDQGNVSCTADNGFGIPPTATASLNVQFRARVAHMPAITYAGLGLRATLPCPSEAQPPVNKVVWRKDKSRITPYQDSRVSMTGEGSLVIEPASLQDAGRYTCTPHNIHGTLGESTATELRIRNPPYFTQKPKRTYEAKLGEGLTVPCKGEGDPPPAVSWRKQAKEDAEAVEFSVEMGTLTIDPVAKTAHGTWQCVLTNSVAEVTEDVKIHVKYTVPHKVTNVTAIAIGESAIRVEWIPGYDGGYAQKFFIWYRQAGETDPSWQTHDVAGFGTVAVLDNLPPGTAYEVAVLPENRIRSGPFSDTVTAETKVSRPPANTVAPSLPAPHALYSSTTEEGLVQLSWRATTAYHRYVDEVGAAIPLASDVRRKILGFLVEYRWTAVVSDETQATRAKRAAKMPARGRWEALTTTHENVTAVVVTPDRLYRDLNYDFRVLAASEQEYSPPSTSVPFSTKGLTAYPCYVAPPLAAAVIDGTVVAGVLTGAVLALVVVGVSMFCCCRWRRRKKGDTASEEIGSDSSTSSTVNGHVVARGSPQSTVVILTENGTAVVKRGNRGEADNGEHAKTPFIGNNNNNDIEEASKVFSEFLAQRSCSFDSDSRKETLSSDRSSVRLRRETTARVLVEQYKRRSLSDHTYHKVHRGIPFRGGTRSASTSPERNGVLARPDHFRATAVWEDQRGCKRIRLYSRPIDDSGCGSAQQRRMILIKRKSHRSSGSEAGQNVRAGAPPSDSSESPVFGVVGTLRRSSADDVLNGGHSQTYWRPPLPRRKAPFEVVTSAQCDDVIGVKDDYVILRSDCPPSPRTCNQVFSMSPRDIASPDVSPNRVVARRTVEYDPKVDPVISLRPRYPGSPTQWDDRCNESNLLTQERGPLFHSAQRGGENHGHLYSSAPYPGNSNFSRASHYYQNMGRQMAPPGPALTRYSFARHSHHGPATLSPPASALRRLIPPASRSRASSSFHRYRPLELHSPPPAVFDHRPVPSLPSGRSAQPSASGPWSPQPPSTCEIDCSNSDIEVRFLKDPDDDTLSPVTPLTSPGEVATVGPVTRCLSTVKAKNAGSASTPSGDRANLVERMDSSRKMSEKLSSHATIPSPVAKSSHEHHSTDPTSTQAFQGARGHARTRSRSLFPFAGQATQSSPRHVKLKSSDGSDGAPSFPPLGAIGSSDYGSQDTSNSSASPHAINSGPGPTSPFRLRCLGASTQDGPPRARDNSSVEDNYEWDSEVAMESEILEALRHFVTLKKPGPVSDEILDELHKITTETKKSVRPRQRAYSADILESRTNAEDEAKAEREDPNQNSTLEPTYSNESMARRCAALRAEFLRYQELHRLDEGGIT